MCSFIEWFTPRAPTGNRTHGSRLGSLYYYYIIVLSPSLIWVVVVAAREVVNPIVVVEPSIIENLIAPGIELDCSSEGVERVERVDVVVVIGKDVVSDEGASNFRHSEQ
jgi:hypothetical protein